MLATLGLTILAALALPGRWRLAAFILLLWVVT